MKQKFTQAIVILLLASGVLACSFPGGKRVRTWHVVPELESAVPDRESVVRQTVTIIERRLDAAGVYDSQVLAQGNGQIRVNLPDVPDRERLMKLITAAGQLELSAVVSPSNPFPVQTYATSEEAAASLGKTLPANRRVLPYVERSEAMTGKEASERNRETAKWVVVTSPAIVEGKDLRDAFPFQSPGDAEVYNINFSLGPEGAEKFGTWTGAHINNYIAVVVNGEIKSIAFIKSQINDRGEITGRYTKQAADDLALILRSGALPVPVKIVEEGANK